MNPRGKGLLTKRSIACLPFLLDVVIDKLQERAKDNALPRHFQRTSVSLMTCARGEKEKRCSSFLPYQCRAPRKSRKRGEALKRLRKEKESANTEEGRQKRVEVRGRESEYRAQLNFIHRLRECCSISGKQQSEDNSSNPGMAI